ncbi:unnamed protein product, partial [Musa textilis]
SPAAAEEIVKNQDLNFASARIAGYLCSGIAFCPFDPYWKQLHKLCFMELLSTSRIRIRSFASIRKEETRLDERHLDEFRDDHQHEREALHADEQDCVPGGVRPGERALGAIP